MGMVIILANNWNKYSITANSIYILLTRQDIYSIFRPSTRELKVESGANFLKLRIVKYANFHNLLADRATRVLRPSQEVCRCILRICLFIQTVIMG